MAQQWRGDGMESDLRLRHAGDGRRSGVVLALPSQAKGQCREPGGIRKVFLL